MYRRLLHILTVSAVVLCTSCATSPESSSSADGHEAAMKAHQEFAECGLFCTLIDALLDSGPDTHSVKSCRDPVTSPPSGPPRC